MTDYRSAGVDLDAADDHTERITPLVMSTWHDGVVGGFGGFAAGVALPEGYRHPVLMLSNDGVGTKLDIARRTNRWEGVGFDLVAMCVDDLVVAGATPLAFVDYLAVGGLHPDRDRDIVESVARACAAAGCALIGGETAEHPGVMEHDAVDLAGTAMGVVERGEELGPHRVAAGDVVVGLHSPNLRSNGFSLVRRVFEGADLAAMALSDDTATLGEVLLGPSVIYAPTVLEAVATGGVRAGAHVTGGGLESNLARSIPPGMKAVIDHASWDWPAVFTEIQRRGGIGDSEMRRAFNLGIGFCLVVDPERLDPVLGAVASHQPRLIGHIEALTP
ncbi:phosphoribosylformylglycinamidine cyclo-ligase [soil metagenome]